MYVTLYDAGMADLPEGYDPRGFPRFAVTVDLVALTITDDELRVLLVRRGQWPYEGMWALPGGFVQAGADANLARAAQRELDEETGLLAHTLVSAPERLLHLEQIGAYWRPGRDPRPGVEVATVAYLAVLPNLLTYGEPRAGGDAAEAAWRRVDDVLQQRLTLAFDHGEILADGVERARAKLESTALATRFLPAEFSVADLQGVYETVWGVPLDKRNFHRKVTGARGFLLPIHEQRASGGRPAELYRRGPAEVLYPAILRHRGSRRRRAPGESA